MVYLTIVSNKIRKFDNIISETETAVKFTSRIERPINRYVADGGFISITDEDWEKLRRRLKLFDEYGISITADLKSWSHKMRRKYAEFFTEEFELDRRVFGIEYGYTSINYGFDIEDVLKIKEIKLNEYGTVVSVDGEKVYSKKLIKEKLKNNQAPANLISIGNIYIPSESYKVDDGIYADDDGYVYAYSDKKMFKFTGNSYLTNKHTLIDTFSIPDRILEALKIIYKYDDKLPIFDSYKEYNYIEMVDNKTISYIPKNRLERFNNGEPREKLAQTKSITRFVKDVFELYDSQIEKLAYELDFDTNDFSDIQIISGEKIPWAYAHGSISGTIGNSCMRNKSSDVFDIYKDNAEMVCIIENGIVIARALLWELKPVNIVNGKSYKFMDRIYVNNDRLIGKMKAFARNNGFLYLENQTFNMTETQQGIKLTDFYVQLKSSRKYNKYPFLDTFCIKTLDRLTCIGIEERLR